MQFPLAGRADGHPDNLARSGPVLWSSFTACRKFFRNFTQECCGLMSGGQEVAMEEASAGAPGGWWKLQNVWDSNMVSNYPQIRGFKMKPRKLNLFI